MVRRAGAVCFSSVPTLVDRGIEGRQAVHPYLLTARDDGYVVMPGAHADSAASQESWLLSNQAGACRRTPDPRDRAGEAGEPAPGGARRRPLRVHRAALPGGAADNPLARYAERAERHDPRSCGRRSRAYRGAVELRRRTAARSTTRSSAVTQRERDAARGFWSGRTARRAPRRADGGAARGRALDGARAGLGLPRRARDADARRTPMRDRVSGDAWRVRERGAAQRLERLQGRARATPPRTHEPGMPSTLPGTEPVGGLRARAQEHDAATARRGSSSTPGGGSSARSCSGRCPRATVVQRRDAAVRSRSSSRPLVLHAAGER